MTKATMKQGVIARSFRLKGLWMSLGMICLTGTLGCQNMMSGSEDASSKGTGGGIEEPEGEAADESDSGGKGAPNPGESEQEGPGAFARPVVSQNYVFHLSATSAKISAMNSQDLSIKNIFVGHPPIDMVAVPMTGQSGAKVAVLGRNQTQAEVALVRLDAQGQEQVSVHEVVRGVNAVTADPSGRYVLAYHNVNSSVASGAGSDQELSVLSLATGVVTDVSVGAHPREVHFVPGQDRAYVVTADGVTVINLAGLASGGKQPLIPVVPRIGLDPSRLEIKIDLSSGQAVARANDIAKLWVTNLSSGEQFEFALSSPATDLDVVAGRALAVIPGAPSSSLVELALPARADSVPTVALVQDSYVGVGEYGNDGNTALLYTTQSAGASASSDPRAVLTVLRKGAGDWADQQKLFVEVPIRQIGVAPDNANAILLHKNANKLNPDAPYAYTLVDLSAQFPIKKLQHVTEPVHAVLMTTQGNRAALTTRAPGSGVGSVELISLRSFVVDSQRLASPAEQIGYVEPSDTIFVSQAHPLGRVSLFDAQGGVQTVTGFELEEGVKVD